MSYISVLSVVAFIFTGIVMHSYSPQGLVQDKTSGSSTLL